MRYKTNMIARRHIAAFVIATAASSALGCATGGPAKVASCVPSVDQRHDADSSAQDGCYDCLLRARDAYQRLIVDCHSSQLLVRLFDTQLLVTLRERELAIDDEASMAAAERLAARLPATANASRYLGMVAAIRPDAEGMGESRVARTSEDVIRAELAWLDWTLRRAFDGPDAEAVKPELLAEVDWDKAVLIFVPTLTMGEVTTNSAAIWGSLADEKAPPAAERLAAPASIRIWRSGLTPKYRTIENFERRALTLAMAGSSFADLCALLVEDGDADRAAQNVGAALAVWLQDGLISDVRGR